MSGEKPKLSKKEPVEKSFVARVTSGRRLGVPLVICRLLDLEEGDIVHVTVKKEAETR